MKAQIRNAHRRFFAVTVSYFMGLFNDHFYKEAALLLAVMQGRIGIQSAAAAVFTVSYMCGAAPGGWMSDRFAKGRVIILAKGLELAAMLVGALGIWYGNWPLVLAMIGLMGFQSAVFGPAMNGTIPELFSRDKVQPVNTAVRITATAAIFIGMALAGYVMDMRQPSWQGMPRGHFLVGLLVLVAAGAGLAISFWGPRVAPQCVKARFPWRGPAASLFELAGIGKDRLLAACVYGNIFIWSLASVVTLLMVNLGIYQFALPATLTAGMKIIFLAGVAGGGLLSNVIARERQFFRVLIPCHLVMAVLLMLVGFVPRIVSGTEACAIVTLLIALTGVAGGIILIPLASFIQIRPAPHKKGRIIAAANFAAFAGMTLGAGVLLVLNRLFMPTTSLGILGFFTALFGLWLARRLSRALHATRDAAQSEK